MYGAAYSRNTDRAAKAYLARKAAKEREENAERIAKEEAELVRRRLEKLQRQQEAIDRFIAERDAQAKYMDVVSSFREVNVLGVNRPKVRDIVNVVLEKTRFTFEDVIGPRRTKDIIPIRHYAMFRVWAMRPDMSLPGIGRAFGGRDHTTVLHAIGKFGFNDRKEALRFIRQKEAAAHKQAA